MTTKKPVIVALLMAAGNATRFGGHTAKQFVPLLGKPLLLHAYDTLSQHPDIDDVFVVAPAAVAGIPDNRIVAGGHTRQDSVRRGLDFIKTQRRADIVLIHDGARPCLSSALISRIVAATQAHGAALPVLPVTDSLKYIADGIVTSRDRKDIYTVQTPQGFNFDKIHAAHIAHAGKDMTDDAALFETAGNDITTVTGDRCNIKITYPADIAVATGYMMQAYGDIRVGNGYDVHQLVPRGATDRALKIGGVVFPHDHILDGHSDADVALHAIADAICGAAGDGDIGFHFPPSDTRWKNADSADLLTHIAHRLHRRDGIIAHIDLTVICEMPKISPARDDIRNRIAAILNITPDRVSVKATTTEKLGFTGRGEGIAAQATATIRLKFSQQEPAS